MKQHAPQPREAASPIQRPSESEVDLRVVTDADWARLCQLVKLPPEAREELEKVITGHKLRRCRRPPNPSQLRHSLMRVGEDAQRLAMSIGDLSGRAKLLIEMVRQKEAIENRYLGLVEAVAGTGEFSGSGFLWEIVEKITLLQGCAASAAAAKISLESRTTPTFLFILGVDKLLFDFSGKRVERPSEKNLEKVGSSYSFVCEVCKIAGIETGIDDAVKDVIKMRIGKARKASSKKGA
jgi:hypothetical protein